MTFSILSGCTSDPLASDNLLDFDCFFGDEVFLCDFSKVIRLSSASLSRVEVVFN